MWNPTVRSRRDTIGPNSIQNGVIRHEGPLFARSFIDSDSTATQHTDPDITPAVFGNAPDVVGDESVARICRTVVLPSAVFVLQQSALVGAKPQATILRGIAAHDDVAGDTETLSREGVDGLQRLGIHLDDTTVVAPDPIITLLVFTDGIGISL